MILRMPASDYDDVVKSISAWHALAPDIFPMAIPPQKRLVGIDHSTSASKDGVTTHELVAGIAERVKTEIENAACSKATNSSSESVPVQDACFMCEAEPQEEPQEEPQDDCAFLQRMAQKDRDPSENGDCLPAPSATFRDEKEQLSAEKASLDLAAVRIQMLPRKFPL
jgi:hypothetical protein